MLTLLSGGTGGVKLAQGFVLADRKIMLNAIVNVAEDAMLTHGYLSPDIDSMIYALAFLIDETTWHGRKDDTFFCHEALRKFGAGEFLKIGDKDRALHIWRKELLSSGYKLCEITEKQCRAFNVEARVMPASDDRIETRIFLEEGREVNLHEYLVKFRDKKVEKIAFKGIEKARACEKAVKAIKNAEKIVIGPSNIITSISPIIKIKEIENELKKNKEKVIAVSPVKGSRAFSGPVIDFMRAFKIEANIAGIAEFYKKIASKLIVSKDESRENVEEIKKLGIEPIKACIELNTMRKRKILADFILKHC